MKKFLIIAPLMAIALAACNKASDQNTSGAASDSSASAPAALEMGTPTSEANTEAAQASAAASEASTAAAQASAAASEAADAASNAAASASSNSQ